MHSSLRIALTLAWLISMAGCQGNDPSEPSWTAIFSPDVTTPGPNSVSLQPSTNGETHIKIAVHLEQISNGSVYAAAFDLSFRPVILEYEGFEQGDFLEQSGTAVAYQVSTEEGNPGKVIVGASLVGDAAGVTGSGTLLTLKFKALAADTSPMTYGMHELRDNTPPAGVALTGIAWYAGRTIVS